MGVIKQDYEKDSINTICDAMRLWMHDAHGGLPLPTLGRDTPQRAYRLRRDTDFQRQSYRH